MYSKIRRTMNKPYWESLLFFVITLVFLALIIFRVSHDDGIIDGFFKMGAFSLFASVYKLLEGMIGNLKSKKMISSEGFKRLKEAFREEKVKEYPKLDLYVTEEVLVYTKKFPVAIIPMSSVKKMVYGVHKKADKEGKKAYMISIVYGKDKVVFMEGKDEADVKRYYNDLYSRIYARNPDVVSYSPCSLNQEEVDELKRAYEYYGSKYKVAYIPNADFPEEGSETAFSLYYEEDGEERAVVFNSPKIVTSFVKAPNGEWVAVENVINDGGYQGLIEKVGKLLEKKKEDRTVVKNFQSFGVLNLILAIVFLLLGLVMAFYENGLALAIMMWLFAAGFFYSSFYQKVWKIELSDGKISYKDLYGKTKVVDADDIDEVKYSSFFGDYSFYSKGKRLFGIINRKASEAQRLVIGINCSKKGQPLKFPE